MKTCTLFNARSGGAAAIGPQLEELTRRDHSKLVPLDQVGCEQKLIDLLKAERPERVIIVGGDGTVSQTMAVLGGNDLPDLQFGIIPTGTGNDLARSLDIPLGDVEAAWQLALGGTAREMDIIKTSLDEPRYLMNAITAGIGGKVAQEILPETKQTYGPLAYWMAALSVLSDPPTFHVRLRLDGQEIIEKDLFAFSIGNGRCAGGGFQIAPDAMLDDGKLQITVMPAMSTMDMFNAGLTFVLTHEDAAERITTYEATEIEVESSPAIPCSLDGEKGNFEKLKFHVIPRARLVVGGPNAAFGV